MKKALKLVCLTLVFSMLFSLTAFAADITISNPDIDVDAKTAVVSGTVTDSDDNQQVVILVLANGAKLGDASISDDDIAYIDQVGATATETEGEKSFSFSFGINTDKFSGTSFTAYVGGTDVASADSKNLRFAAGGPGDCASPKADEVCDGIVGYPDYIFVVSNYNMPTTSDDAIIQARFDAADSNGNNIIDYPDYITVTSNYTNDYNN